MIHASESQPELEPLPEDQEPQKESQTPKPKRRKRRVSLSLVSFILLVAVNIILLLLFAWPLVQSRYGVPVSLPWLPTETSIPTASPQPTSTVTPNTPTATVSADKVEILLETLPDSLNEPGVLILSMREGLNTHLFAYRPLIEQPDLLPLTRLTSGPWDDISPALSPADNRLAFASNREGEWHIYVWDLGDGSISQLTQDPGFKASPTWSPDGLWLTYERYFDNNLDLFIQQADPDAEPIRLTTSLAADYAPAWSPRGRQIAFVSTRGGKEEIWLADLDKTGQDRFTLVEHPGELTARHPSWSLDGRYLSWSAIMEDGLHKIFIWDTDEPSQAPRQFGSGDFPVWSHDDGTLFTTILSPQQTYLTAYSLARPDVQQIPLTAMPGPVESMLWADLTIFDLLPDEQVPTPTPLWNPDIHLDAGAPGGRWGLVDLQDVDAPYARLHDRVDEAFNALRQQLSDQAGWDVLSSLENAYVPLTSVLPPGQKGDWLYTGRAIAINTLPINAGWMIAVREDFGQETYWRIYLRARFQDGTQGRPLYTLPWNFEARYRAEPLPYDQGGELAQAVPPGYWVDMTQLAATYGWQRLPSLSNWRSVYTSARFNELVFTDGLDWTSAMLELYPPEAIITPTPIPTATNTPTITPSPTRTQTPTITPTPTNTATHGPTLTPSETPLESATPTVTTSSTPTLSATP
jgi:TolB protein